MTTKEILTSSHLSAIVAALFLFTATVAFTACTEEEDDEEDIQLIAADSSTDEEDTNNEDDSTDETDDTDDTSTDSVPESGTGYVDLGLSVKWADHNVGASKASAYGQYFAWGETSPKSLFTSNNSVTCGMNLDDISGDPAYDAATVNWGGAWRIPTADEWEELIEKCTWAWDTCDGVVGYRITGTAGNSIFLPYAGYRNGTARYDSGSHGYYWSSTPEPGDNSSAYYVLCTSGYHNVYYYGGHYDSRHTGFSIRPVKD